MNTQTHIAGPISYEEVKEAMTACINAGESTNLENIRTHLGTRGSFATISKFRKEILRDAEDEERRKNPDIPEDQVRQVCLGQSEHLMMTAYAAGLRRGRDMSREVHAKVVTLEQDCDQLLADVEEGQRTMQEKNCELDRVKQAGENALAAERRRVDDARLEAEAVRQELTTYQARTGGKIETLEEALRLAKDELNRTQLNFAKAQGKIALLAKACPRS